MDFLKRCSLICFCFVLTSSNRVISIDSSFSTTATLGPKKTNELCEYYGYQPEVHTVTTDDEYILTLFRCNSKTATKNGQVVILQHGFLGSSDDYCTNIPSQSLAYIMADEGYDVWMPNFRGNFYSRHNDYKNPNIFLSGFWKFSFDTIAYHDIPAILNYMLQVTGVSKFYYVGHSQGTSSIMTLLSVKPEYNNFFKAIALLAPIGYMGHAATLYQVLGDIQGPLQIDRDQEFLPRGSTPLGVGCNSILVPVCMGLFALLFGNSENLNSTMMGTYLSHFPAGSSTTIGLHYLQEIKYDYFGPQMDGFFVPSNYPVNQITVPITLHYSDNDAFTNPIDVKRLIGQLSGSLDLQIQEIQTNNFGHIDFVYGITSSTLIYPKILTFFQKHL